MNLMLKSTLNRLYSCLRFIKLPNWAIVLLLVVLFTPIPALAYVDPGSGSAIVTTILGLMAAVGYTFRKAFYKMKRRLFGKKPNHKN